MLSAPQTLQNMYKIHILLYCKVRNELHFLTLDNITLSLNLDNGITEEWKYHNTNRFVSLL